MADERKVICPWCGWDMVAREGQDIFHGKYNVYVCDGCEATSPIAYSEDAAYAAATQRPPNLPMTREQVEVMPDNAAVWYVTDSCTLVLIERACIVRGFWSIYENDMLFASMPTPADIEAARKGRIE